MNKTIFRAILVTAVFIMLFSLVAVLLAVNLSFEMSEEERLRAETKVLGNAVEDGGLDYLESLDVQDYRITWISNNGTVLFDNAVNVSSLEEDRKSVV